MRLATWNINSIRARMPLLAAWVKTWEPDVLLLQEIKCQQDDFPTLECEAMGYRPCVVGQKSYNGVALLSKHPVEDLSLRLAGNPEDTQARYIEAKVKGIRIAALYAPNGNPVESEKFSYKLAWMRRLKARIEALLPREEPFVFAGDWNVIPQARDVFDVSGWEQDALYHPETRRLYREMLALGLVDAYRACHPNTEQAYSFWDYQAGSWQRNAGLRIDHFLLSPEATDLLIGCQIDAAARGEEKASDHAPVVLDLRC